MKKMQFIQNKGLIRDVTRLFFLAGVGLSIMLVSACNKDNENTKEKAHLSIRMTDAPANYNAVLIDLQSVEVTGDNGGTFLLNANAGIYNLLDYANGFDTLIAIGDLNAGKVSQIRLILGPNNSVIIDNVAYPLSTPSAQQSGLKLQVHRTFEPGVSYMLLLDFDANQSITLTGNGEYQLKPVIRVIDAAVSGSIKGSISPLGIMAMITATSGDITYSSVNNSNGQFLLPGLPAGIYNVIVNPEIPYAEVTLFDVAVVTGVSTDLGLIAL